jgi:glyoxylase-like metal-dependent hydrolase (beta-lactamase superfamily II)
VLASREMDVTRVGKGLWRWTAPHPEWKEGDDWDRDVGCVYWESEGTIVLVDPLVPLEEAERDRFLAALDRDVERVGSPVAVLLTCSWHSRSVDELAERYDARVHLAFGRDSLPDGVTAVEAPTAEEVLYWLEGARAIVPGDVLIGTAEGLSLCPESWLEGRGGLPELVCDLAPLLDLPAERVLTSHGPPVVADGRAALERALAAG